jgi:ribosomal protein S18 acetylase RimI-like enzyme
MARVATATGSPSSADVVRVAQPEDAEEVTRLIAEFRDWWGKSGPSTDLIRDTAARLLADPQTAFLLAFDAFGAAVGVCQLRYRLSVWTGVEDGWLEDLFVTASARSGGHGRELVEAAFDSARARGCKRIELDVNEQNEAALRFYESLGFTTKPKPPGRTLFISRIL